MRLAVQQPGNLLHRQPGRQLPMHHQKLVLILSHTNHSITPRKNRFVPAVGITAVEFVSSVNWNPGCGNGAQFVRSVELSTSKELVPQSSTPSTMARPQ